MISDQSDQTVLLVIVQAERFHQSHFELLHGLQKVQSKICGERLQDQQKKTQKGECKINVMK